MRSLARQVGGYAVGLAATSLIAGTATAVFGAYHFQRVSPLSLGANLAAMPFVSVMVMPFAMFGMILMPFGLDGWAFWVMGKGLSAMIAVANWFSELSPIDSVGLVPAAAVVVLTIALVLATLPTTWLRLAALPVALAGLAIVSTRTLAGCCRLRRRPSGRDPHEPTVRLPSTEPAPTPSPRRIGKRR